MNYTQGGRIISMSQPIAIIILNYYSLNNRIIVLLYTSDFKGENLNKNKQANKQQFSL